MNDDVTWARAVLGPANPVPQPPADASFAPPVPAVATPVFAPRPPRRRALVVGALATAAALVAAVVTTVALAGGNSHHGTVTTAVVFAAAADTAAAHTADVSVTVTTSSTSFSAQGAADLTSGDGDFTVDLPAQLGQVEVRSTGGTVYVRVPAALSGLAGDKPWVSAHEPTRASTTSLTFDATWLLDWLRAAAGPVTTVGTNEVVHGDPTTHYRATVDLSKVRGNLAGHTVPVDVWVDGSGRLRQLTASFDASSTPLGHVGTVQLNAQLWGFGTPVQVTAPPADQVADGTALLPAAQRLLGGI